MPRQPKGGESKQGLVITLVFSIIVSLALGVVAYLGFADTQSYKDKLKNETAKSKTFEEERNFLRFQTLVLTNALGLATTDDEKEALQALGLQFDQGRLGKEAKDKDEVTKKLATIFDEAKVDREKKLAKNSYRSQIKLLTTQIAEANEKLAQSDKTNKELIAKLQLDLENTRKDAQLRIEEAKKKGAEILVVGKDKTKEFLDLQESHAKMSEQLAKDKKVWDDEKAKYEAKFAQMDKDLTQLRNRYRDVQARVAPVNLLDHDQPKAKIVSLNRTGSIAYINVGSADGVKPQLSFAVVGKDQFGKVRHIQVGDKVTINQTGAEGEIVETNPEGVFVRLDDGRRAIYNRREISSNTRKAAVEILDVLEPHLSSARVIDVARPGSDPVLQGDLLFNTAWNPNMKKHIAIAGLIDLDGDGLDDTQEFIRNMEKQDVVVDGYLDLREEDLTKPEAFKGEMSFKTDYLVLGQVPEIDQGLALRQNDPRLARSQQVVVRLSDLQSQAGLKGITIVPARRFMALIGYRLPKNPRAADYAMRGGIIFKKAEPKPDEANR